MSVDSVHEAVFAHVGPWTEDDYFALPDVPAKVELVDGALLVPTLTSIAHQRLIFEVTKLLAESCADPRWEALPGANVRLWAGSHSRARRARGPGRVGRAESRGR